MRTSGDSASAGLPITRATALSDLSLDSKPKIRKVPNSVGKAASATLTVFMGGSIARGFGSLREENVVRSAALTVGSERSKAQRCAGCFDFNRSSPGVVENQI